MTWVKIDDRMPEHPKVAGLSDRAFRAHVEALCYCAGVLTDGRIPAVVAKGRKWTRAAAELVAARLWETADDGWAVHDYLKHQRSKEEAIDLSMKRAEAGARGGKAKANSQTNTKQIATPLLKQSGLTRSEEIREEEIERDQDQNPPTPLRVEFWNRGCALRGLLSLSSADDAVIDSWIAAGVTLETWTAVEAEIRTWNPEHPWGAFKSEMGARVARGALAVVRRDEPRFATPEETAEDEAAVSRKREVGASKRAILDAARGTA